MTVNATATKSVDFQRMRLLFLVREFAGFMTKSLRWDVESGTIQERVMLCAKRTAATTVLFVKVAQF
jgi:hypothetical protein